jgi:riboflavin kinase/FMN adenylyltransferase
MQMLIYPNTNFKLPKSVVTVGTFDGVHLGHQKILKTLKEVSEKNSYASVVVTFESHPQFVLNPQSVKTLRLITTLDEKKQILETFGIDFLVVLNFNLEMARKTSTWFVEEVLIKQCNAALLVLGYDHRFGKDREGSFEFLMRNKDYWNLELIEIPKQEMDSIKISSTQIREYLAIPNFTAAKFLLGREYSFEGNVVEGKKFGRLIGFPTANIKVDELKLLPPNGVYLVKVQYDNATYIGMLNIGFKPTVGSTELSIEVHILNFNQNIYNEKLTIFPIQKIRDEKKFSSLDELKNQIQKDKETCLNLIKNGKSFFYEN